MIDEKHIWDFIQSTHEKYKNKGGFTILKDITIISVDKLYLVNCYNNGKKLMFSIFIEHKSLFTDEQRVEYTLTPAQISNEHSSIMDKMTDDPKEVWEFMIPIVRDISLNNLGINS